MKRIRINNKFGAAPSKKINDGEDENVVGIVSQKDFAEIDFTIDSTLTLHFERFGHVGGI